MVSYYQPEGRPNLYIKYKLDGGWKAKATKWLPGQETEALAEARRLEGADAAPPDKLTVWAWADRWLNDRSERVRDWANDKSRLEHHVLPAIGEMLLADVRPAHLVNVVEDMKAKGLAPRTIRNTYSVVKAMWRDARLMDICQADPCILTARQLGKLRDKDLGWRREAVFTRDEMVSLIGDDRLPVHRRVLWGLLGLGGLRDGEACGLRWKHVDLEATPLGRLTIVASYDNDTTKTEAERWMPVHPVLGTLLRVWQRAGWAAMMHRSPTPEDLVVPAPLPTNRGPRKAWGAMLDRHWVWKRLQKDVRLLEMRPRRVHDLRRTLISLAVEDGADENILKRGTHAPPSSVMAMYTTVAWERLCQEVVKLDLLTERGPPEKWFGLGLKAKKRR